MANNPATPNKPPPPENIWPAIPANVEGIASMSQQLLPNQLAFATVVDTERAKKPTRSTQAPFFFLICRLLAWLMPKLTVVLACAIAGLVAAKLVDVHVSVDSGGLETSYQCLLGQNYMSSNLCTYTFVVVGFSLVCSLAISLLQSCTCNLCGAGGVLDTLFGAFGTIWWAVASGVIGDNATDDLVGVDPAAAAKANDARNAVPIMCWVETGLFAAMLVASLFRSLGKCCYK